MSSNQPPCRPESDALASHGYRSFSPGPSDAIAVVAGLIDRGLHPQRPPDTDEVRDVLDRLLFFPDEPGE